MGREATLYLLERGVRVTGTDAWSWDAPFVHTAERYAREHDASIIWEGHRAGREIGYCHIEKLHNLESLPDDGFEVACFPVKVRRRLGGVDAGGGDPAVSENQKRLPSPGPDVEPSSPAVALDQPLADRQAEPVAGSRWRRRALEGAEDPSPVRGRDAGAVVLDRDTPAVPASSRSDRATRGCRGRRT